MPTDLVQIAQLTNSRLSYATNYTEEDIEDNICYNLTRRILPDDLSNNLQNTSLNIYKDADESGSQLIGRTMILNNETLINNELFGMKIDYVEKSNPPDLDSYDADIGNIKNSIYLDSSTNSIFDSNLKIDISFNNDQQFTDDISNVNTGIWGVTIDRSESERFVNTFAAVNSLYNRTDGISPFYIEEELTNNIALGNDLLKWFSTNDETTGDKKLVANDISEDYTLSSNFINGTLNSDSSNNYTFGDFNMYKLYQSRPTITASVPTENKNFSHLPIQYVDDGSSNIASDTFNFDGAFQDTIGVGSGFTLKLDISNGGGYSIDENNLFTINDNNLTRDALNPYMGLTNLLNLSHQLVITNGDVTLHSNYSSGNAMYIDVCNNMVETLGSDNYDKDGLITICVDTSDNRVYYHDGDNTDNHGNKNSTITDNVYIVYRGEEVGDFTTYIDNQLLTESNVEANIEVLAPSTVYTNPTVDFINNDNRNIAYDSSTILTVVYSDQTYNDNTKLTGVTLTSSINDDSNINIISIHNESILTEDTPLLDIEDINVSGTTATVKMTNVDLKSSSYSKFAINLNTKTISELQNALHPTNNWTLLNQSDYLIGNAYKTGIINDSYLFMTSAVTDVSSIDVSYTFCITNPDCGNISSIKRAIKATFNDITDDNLNDDSLTISQSTTSYINEEDISFVNVKEFSYTTDIAELINSTNQSNYPRVNYDISRNILIRTYNARFDPKIQFYENVKCETPTIVEKITYYTITEKSTGIARPYLLKNFKFDTKNLANVQVDFLDYTALSETVKNAIDNGMFDINNKTEIINNISGSSPLTPYTLISYSKSACSIFKASIYGLDVNDVFQKLGNHIDIDPFFKQTGTITNFLSGNPSAETTSLMIQFSGSTRVTDSLYNVYLSNQPGVNQSFKAKIYTTNGNNANLDDYDIYKNYYNKQYMSVVPIEVINVNGQSDQSVQLKIYADVDRTILLATIDSSKTLVNSFNIISIPKPFFKVDYTIGNNKTTTRVLRNDKITIANGIYYYFNNILLSHIGQTEHFNLVSDAFQLKFVDNDEYYTNNSAYTSKTRFTTSNIRTWLISDYVRSIMFKRLRGYAYVNSGQDNIVINRSKTTGEFRLHIDNTNYASQSIADIFNGKQVILNTVNYNGTIYSLGLELNFTESMLSTTDDTEYSITVSIADYSVSVIANNYNENIKGIVSFGDLITNQSDLLTKYFANVKPASIKSEAISLTIEYNVPNMNLYNGTTYIGNPKDNTVWTSMDTYTHNTLLNSGYDVIPAFKIQRDSAKNVFYNSYTAYFVITPPVVSVYGVTALSDIKDLSNISTQVSTYITSFHINHTANHDYAFTGSYSYYNGYNTSYKAITFSFKETTIKPYSEYTTVNSYNKHFRLEGNYVTVKLYANGIGYRSSLDHPKRVDRTSSIIEVLFDRKIMTQLIDSEFIDVTSDDFINYIDYNQYLIPINIHNYIKNIIFSLGNPFTPPRTNINHKYYLRLPANKGSLTSFYQSNIQYHNGHYFINIDKFETGTITDYGLVLHDPSNIDYSILVTANTVNELLFPITKHSTKHININELDMVDSSGVIRNIMDIIKDITPEDISGCGSWTVDTNFTLQYVGITLSAITTVGREKMKDLFKYDYSKYLTSKSLYIYLPDMIQIKNRLGNTVYRVSNGGNVHAPRISTSNLALFRNQYTNNQVNGINGSGDIQSIFIQNSLMDDQYTNVRNNY